MFQTIIDDSDRNVKAVYTRNNPPPYQEGAFDSHYFCRFKFQKSSDQQGISYFMIYFIISGKVERISLSIHGDLHCGGYKVSIEILPQCTQEESTDPSTDPWCKRPWSTKG